MCTPHVSVIIPVRNREDLVVDALSSALAQIDVVAEIILVDDCSTPKLSDVLPDEYREQIRIIRNDVPRNAAYSRNVGARHANAPYLAFLDSDDRWRCDHLKIGLASLKSCEPQALYCSPIYSTQHGTGKLDNPINYVFSESGDLRSSGLICARSNFFSIGGFDALLTKHQDWDFCIRFHEKGSIYVGGRSTIYLDSSAPDRMSGTPDLNGSQRFLERHQDGMTPANLSSFLGGLVKTAAVNGNPKIFKETKDFTLKYASSSQLTFAARVAWTAPWLFRFLAKAKRFDYNLRNNKVRTKV